MTYLLWLNSFLMMVLSMLGMKWIRSERDAMMLSKSSILQSDTSYPEVEVGLWDRRMILTSEEFKVMCMTVIIIPSPIHLLLWLGHPSYCLLLILRSLAPQMFLHPSNESSWVGMRDWGMLGCPKWSQCRIQIFYPLGSWISRTTFSLWLFHIGEMSQMPLKQMDSKANGLSTRSDAFPGAGISAYKFVWN